MKVLLNETIDPERISVSPVPSSKKRSPGLLDDIDHRWTEYQQHGRGHGIEIWDAEIYRLERFDRLGNGLHIELSTIEAKEILAFLTNPNERALGEDYWPRNLFVASLIRTSDDAFIFGGLSGTTSVDRETDIVGGTLSQSEANVGSGRDIVTALHREFAEELNIRPLHVADSHLIGLVLTPKYSIGLIFFSRLAIPAAEVAAGFGRRNNDELKAIVTVEPARLREFLEAGDGYLPLVAELLQAS